MPTSATNSVYNIFNFEWQMWRPMYYAPSGSTPTVDPTLSVANPPVWSNGDKTMTITLKPWKWNTGQTLSSKDLQFTFDMIKAAVKASPANWAPYVPGFFPDTSPACPRLTPARSWSTCPRRSTRPGWNTTSSGPSRSCPAFAWSKDSASGSTLDFTNPANAAKIFNYLTAQAKSVSTYATNPLWQTVYGPYKLTLVQRHHRRVHHGAEHQLQRAARHPHVQLRGRAVHLRTPRSSTPSRAGRSTSRYVPQEDVPQLPQLKGLGYNYYGLPAFGDYFVAYNFKDKTGDFNDIAAQLYFRQAMQHLEDQARPDQGLLQRGRRPGLRPDPGLPEEPVPARERGDQPLPVQRSTAMTVLKDNGWNVVANGTDTCAKPGRPPATAGPASRPAPSWPST